MFDYLSLLDGQGRVETESPGRLEIDHQLAPGWRLHRKVGGFLAPEDAVDIGRRTPKQVDKVKLSGQVLSRRNTSKSFSACVRFVTNFETSVATSSYGTTGFPRFGATFASFLSNRSSAASNF